MSVHKRMLVLVVLTFILAGCATQQQIQAWQSQKYEMNSAIAESSSITCDSKEKCDKIFRVATDIASQYSDMKIQTQGVNNLSTYNPNEYGRVGISVQRIMLAGNAEKINFNVVCKGMYDDLMGKYCYERVASTYKLYKQRVASINAEATPANSTRKSQNKTK